MHTCVQYDEQSVSNQGSAPAPASHYIHPSVNSQRPTATGSGPHTLANPAAHGGRSGEQAYLGRHSQELQSVPAIPQQQQQLRYSGGHQSQAMAPHNLPSEIAGQMQDSDAPPPPIPPRERSPHSQPRQPSQVSPPTSRFQGGHADQMWTQQIPPHTQGSNWPQARYGFEHVMCVLF